MNAERFLKKEVELGFIKEKHFEHVKSRIEREIGEKLRFCQVRGRTLYRPDGEPFDIFELINKATR